jgi:hypothetical protein
MSFRNGNESKFLVSTKVSSPFDHWDMYSLKVINNTGTVKQCRMSEVTGCGILKVFFNKEC